jgi:lipid-binding SYLF domain-containing protein
MQRCSREVPLPPRHRRHRRRIDRAWCARPDAPAAATGTRAVWSDTQGLYARLSAGITGATLDRDANSAYYGRPDIRGGQILDGRIDNPHANVIEMVLRV